MFFITEGKMEQLDNDWILKESSECPLEGSAPATLGLTNMAGMYVYYWGKYQLRAFPELIVMGKEGTFIKK